MSTPRQLPSGRHGLSRDQVRHSQRTRLLDGMIAAVNENGYGATTIVDVSARAGVSRATFYELFEDKEACFLAAYDWLIERLAAYVAPAWDTALPWPDRVRHTLAALLTAIAYRPDAARMATIESLAAGPRAHERYRAAVNGFAPFVDQGRDETPHGAQLPQHLARIVVGGVAATIFEQLAAGHVAELRRRLPELVYLVVMPYLGHERGIEEMKRAS
jgi:AcrR family transcriptional regulator